MNENDKLLDTYKAIMELKNSAYGLTGTIYNYFGRDNNEGPHGLCSSPVGLLGVKGKTGNAEVDGTKENTGYKLEEIKEAVNCVEEAMHKAVECICKQQLIIKQTLVRQ